MARLDPLFEDDGLKVDLSAMIDLVFLLLIFFIVASTIITYQKDPNVVIPIASDSKVPEMAEGRVVINIYHDGTLKDEFGKMIRSEEIEQHMAAHKAKNANTRLHLRADQRVPYRFIKEVSQASARGGVPSVIFSTYQTDK